MKFLIFLLFLSISSYGQNFMMRMDILETRGDSTLRFCDEKVIWGMSNDEICFLWGDRFPICFVKEKPIKIKNRKIRKKIAIFIKEAAVENPRFIKIRDVFTNEWGELYLITIYMQDNVTIWINRVDDKYPHYFLTMTH